MDDLFQSFDLQQIPLFLFVRMLPVLAKNHEREKEFRPADTKLYNPPRELSQDRPRLPLHDSSRNSAKSKVGGGFRLAGSQEERNDALRINEYVAQQSKTMNYVLAQKSSAADLGQEIKAIQKKIRQCKQKLERQKKQKAEQQRRAQEGRYEQDFEEVIRRELQLQGYQNTKAQNNFDYLTNPGGPMQQEEEPPLEEPQTEPQQPAPAYSIAEGIQKLQRFYENSLKKKFQRRQAFPHQACRRKTPKLYITQKTNALNKHGKPLTEEEHKFRVLTRQTTPQQIYPVIPNFAVVKDNLSKNIVAYLGDYRPFLDKTRQKVQQELKGDEGKAGSVGESKSLSVGQ